MPTKQSIDYFHAIANDDFYNLIIKESNEYAVEVLSVSESTNSRISRWKDLTVPELRMFLGLLFRMGTIKMNRITNYWKKHALFNLMAFSQYMARDRFLLIIRTLHFNNNEEDASSIGKILQIIDFFNKRLDVIYNPTREITIDESLVLWRGRLIIRQYMKGKKAKYGIKLYILGQSNGLALNLIVYGGSADKELGGKDHTNISPFFCLSLYFYGRTQFYF